MDTSTGTQMLDEAYERLAQTGPEFDGWLSNHGPMAVESLVRHGHGADISEWLDRYVRRLEEAPRPSRPIADWREALGDPRRLGDWPALFAEQLREREWTQVLSTWWVRLLPGIAASATHGVIRVGHAVRVLREDGETPARIAELASALGYWAARWQPVPAAAPQLTGHAGGARPAAPGTLSAAGALAAVPAVPDQSGGIEERLSQLPHVPGWPAAQAALASRHDPAGLLREVVTAAVLRYATHAHGNPIMLVHAATAPSAVLRVLPSLPGELHEQSAAAAWSASAAIYAAYGPREARPLRAPLPGAADAFDRAARHGGEHVIKLADTALDVWRWSSDTAALAAVAAAADLIE